ncbi:MAG TPA: hypothetical protein VGY97_00985 [Solirubrobacteraceae bacterium]|nr:hypothetical protein [Solirubrobacteraceae bacterium]
MAWKRSVLVVANQTATSPQLREALRVRHEQRPTSFILLVPAGRRPEALELVDRVVAELRGDGLDVTGCVGDVDPFYAVHEIWDPGSYDEILISTLPTGSSRWLRSNLPRRVERLTGALVTHVSVAGAVEVAA